MRFGYITNGFRDHRLVDVFPLLRDLGYEAVGITLDVGHFSHFDLDVAALRDFRASLCGLKPVIETGARYVLDPLRKHRPTLISADPEGRGRRLAYLEAAIDFAADVGARVVSFWSGVREPEVSEADAWAHLVEGLFRLADYAEARGVTLGFEPEPGMFVESLADFRELRRRFADGRLKRTGHPGHLAAPAPPPHDRWIRELADVLVNVHVDDIRGRVHDHLPLGEGEIDFPPIFRALREIGYEGALLVELARHSHMAPVMARRSIEAMRSYSS